MKKKQQQQESRANIVIQIKAAALKRCHSHLCSDTKSGSAAPATFPFQCTGGLLFFSPTYFHIKPPKNLMETEKKPSDPSEPIFSLFFHTSVAYPTFHSFRMCRLAPNQGAGWRRSERTEGMGEGEFFFSSPNYDKIKSMPDTAEEVETAAVYFQQGFSTVRRSG